MEQSRILSKKILRKMNSEVKKNFSEPLFKTKYSDGLIGGSRKDIENSIVKIIDIFMKKECGKKK